MTKIIGVLFIAVAAAFFIIMFMFMTQSLGATDMSTGTTLAGSTYYPVYNTSVNVSKTGVTYLSFAPPMLGIAALVGAMVMIFAAVKFRS